MLTDSDLNKLKKLREKDVPTPLLELIKTDAPQFTELQAFCDVLKESTGFAVKKVAGDDMLPGIKINRQITYHTVPLGPELEPFMMAVGEIPPPGDRLKAAAGKIVGPVQIDIFIAPQCPFCPRAVETLLPLTTASPFIKVAVIDAALFGKTAQKANIQSTPTTLLDQTYRWIGLPPVDELVQLAVRRDPSELSPSALQGMIAEGNAQGLAQLMVDSGKVFPGFIALLIDAKWSTRLGAMAAFEYLVEMDAAKGALYIEPLWDHFENVDAQVQGDIAYLLGESKSSEAVEKLALLTKGPYSNEVKEAGTEALEALSRHIDG